jgi:ribosome-binding protein aMBF1 (putative translation factor)
MLMITKERTKQGLSQSALARKAELHVSSLSAIENGRLNPYPAQIEKLVKALDWVREPAQLFEVINDAD